MFDFKKTRRLILKSDFDGVFNQAHKLVCGQITLLYKPNQLANARLGFAISKKFARQSVLRNKIRRVIKESFRHHKNLSAFDIVVLLNQVCDKQKLNFIRPNIEKLWQKLK